MLKVDNLSVSYGGKTVLKNVSFSLTPHTFTAVVGKNGSGKSTLVSCINQTVRYTGEITLCGKNAAFMTPRERAQTVAVLPQILESPHITVSELALLGRNPYLDLARRPTQADRDAAVTAIKTAGIEPLQNRYLDEISGGERQKAYLAMILAQSTRAIVLDEPTTYLDIESENNFLRQLLELKGRQKKTLMVILHNLNAAVRFADNLAVLGDGELIFYGDRETCLNEQVLENTFGVKRFTADDGTVFFAAE